MPDLPENWVADKSICKYFDYWSIPAKVFFEVRDNKNYQLLRPKPSTNGEVLKAAFAKIYDKWFVEVNNDDAVRYLELRDDIAFFTYKRESIKAVLHFVLQTPSNIWDDDIIAKQRQSILTGLNPYLDEPFDLENDFLDEIQRILNVDLGIIENEINERTFEFDSLKKDTDNKVFNYYASKQGIEETHGYPFKESVLLPEWVEAERSAINKINAQKRLNQNG